MTNRDEDNKVGQLIRQATLVSMVGELIRNASENNLPGKFIRKAKHFEILPNKP